MQDWQTLRGSVASIELPVISWRTRAWHGRKVRLLYWLCADLFLLVCAYAMQLPVDCVVSLGCGSEPRVERSKGLSTVGGGSEAVAVDGCICCCQGGAASAGSFPGVLL